MRFPARLTILSAVALILTPAPGGAQGRDWSFDFRMTDSAIVDGASANAVTTGRAVVSKGRTRLDMKGSSRASSMPRMAAGDEVSMIVEKDGRLITYLLPKNRQYMQFSPAELVKQMQQ